MDASIRTSAYRTANAIAQHVNFEAGWAEVSYDKIADPFGVSHDTIARDLKDLERAGHFHVEWHKGRNGTHRVCWILKPQTRTGGFIGLAHENTVTSKTKAGGNRKGSADLRALEGDAGSAKLRGDVGKSADEGQQNCGPSLRKSADHTLQDNTQHTEGTRSSASPYNCSSVIADVVIDDNDKDAGASTRVAGPALDAPTRAPATDLHDPGTVSDPEHPRDRPVAPISQCEAPIPGGEDEGEDRAYECSPATLPDLKAQAAEEAAALAHADLSALHRGVANLGSYVFDFIDAYINLNESRRQAVISATVRLFGNRPNSLKIWKQHQAVLADLLRNLRPDLAHDAACDFATDMRDEQARIRKLAAINVEAANHG